MAATGSALTLDTASAVDLFELTLNAMDAVHQSPAVDLELCLTRPTGTNATGLLGE
jgi:hypothetical protein